MNLLLQHTPQPLPWGSMYYALYALLGDERILVDVTESSTGRFNLLMAELGHHLQPLWLDQTDTYPAPAEWWQKVLQWNPADYDAENSTDAPVLPLLLHLPTHCISVGISAAPGLPVILFDPLHTQAQHFATLHDFLSSSYGQCTQVYEVSALPGQEFFRPVSGPSLAQARIEARLTLERKLQLNSTDI